MPAAQEAQLPFDAYFPAGQLTGEHEVEPAPHVVPEGQLVQELAPLALEKVPAGQVVHEVAPGFE